MSLMLSQAPDGYQARRHLKRSETRPVLPRHRFVLELHLAGHKVKEIQDLSGYSESTIYDILQSKDVNSLRQQIMSYYDQEFESLFPDVIQAVKDGLGSQVISERLSAATTWLKAHGKLSGEKIQQNVQVNLTAEDIVFNILNQRQESNNENPR